MDKHAENRHLIDAEIAILERRLLLLRAQRNRLAPISCLPIETMSRIFRFAYGVSTSTLPIALSSVSRDWRELAMDLPEIWGTIDNNLKFEHIPAYMALSRQKPLHVTLKGITDDNVDKIVLILKELSRIRRLALNGLRDFVWCSSALWKSQAPILEVLDLDKFHLPKSLFSGQAQSLLQLRLFECDFDWNSLPALPELRYLWIHDPERDIPVDKFLEKLSLMPNLWDVSTKEALTAARNPSSSGNFMLPTLEIFDLAEENCTHIAQMLRMLVLPEFGFRNLVLRLDSDSPESEIAVLDALNTLTKFSETRVETLYLIGRQDSSGFVITEEPVTFMVQFNRNRRTTARDLDDIANRFYNYELQELIVDLQDMEGVEDNAASVWKLINELSEIEGLTVRHDAVRVLATYLSQEAKALEDLHLNPPTDPDIDDDVSPDTLSFFWLKKMSISGYGIQPRDFFSYLDTFSQYLHIRQRWEREVPTLVISSESPLPDQQIAALQKVVKEFTVVTHDLNTEHDKLFEYEDESIS